jgi:hypothetical protein
MFLVAGVVRRPANPRRGVLREEEVLVLHERKETLRVIVECDHRLGISLSSGYQVGDRVLVRGIPWGIHEAIVSRRSIRRA